MRILPLLFLEGKIYRSTCIILFCVFQYRVKIFLCLLFFRLFTLLPTNVTLATSYDLSGSCKESVERIWVLALALKALLKTLSGGFSEDMRELYSPEFVQCVVYLASQGTQFSRQWLLKDLEVSAMQLYVCNRSDKGSL